MSETEAFPRTLRIGILVFEGFEPIDVWGFAEAFGIARFIGTNYASGPPYPFEVVLISNQCRPDGEGAATPAPVKSANGPRVAPDLFRDEALERKIDLLMIPGGSGTRLLLADEPPQERSVLLRWVRSMDERVSVVTSVCTGAAILAAAGLLDGKPAATNHAAFAWVTGFGPRVHWDNVSRWVDAGRYVTSAGVSSGTDMGFYLVQRLAGRAIAEVAAQAAEYDWHRDPEEPIYYPQQAVVPGTRGPAQGA
jgi:putative intracellular protease/amidase